MVFAPNVFKEDASRNLVRIFPPAMGKSEFNLPQVLLPTIQLTHDYLSTLPYVAVSILDAIGANDILSVIMATGVPDGFVWIVDSLGLWTDDAVNRLFTVWIHYINSVGDFAIPILNITNGAAVQWTAHTNGRFIMPPASKLELTIPALTAGKHMRFTMAFLAVPAGQFVPRA